MGFILFWVITSVVVAALASSKGKDFGKWLALSILLSPVVAIVCLIVTLMPDAKEEAVNYRKCPFCAEQILSEAKKCKYCHSLVEPIKNSAIDAYCHCHHCRQPMSFSQESDLNKISCGTCGFKLLKPVKPDDLIFTLDHGRILSKKQKTLLLSTLLDCYLIPNDSDKFEKCKRYLKEYHDIEPGAGQLYKIALLYYQNSEKVEALNYLNAVLQADTKSPDVTMKTLYQLIKILCEEQQLDQAKNYYNILKTEFGNEATAKAFIEKLEGMPGFNPASVK